MLGCNFVGTPSKLSLFDLFNFIRRRTDMRDLAPTNVARAVALIESGQTYRAVYTNLYIKCPHCILGENDGGISSFSSKSSSTQ
jgi:hypothetical protein